MYVVPASLSTNCPIMLIDTHIGMDADLGMGVDGSTFQRELLELDHGGYKCIRVWINSPGGVVMDGYSIYNAILKTKTSVDTYCMGIAASIAAVVFQAGRKRIMSDYGRLMFHNPFGSDDKKAMTAIQSSIVTMVSSRSGKSADEISAMMDKTSWIIPEDALMHGLCDSIELSNSYNVPRATSAKNFYAEAGKVLNSILKTDIKNESMSLSKVTNILNLNPEASEDAVVKEINTINNKAIKAEQDKIKAENDLTIVKNQLEDEKKNRAKDISDKDADHAKALAAKDEEITNLKDSYKTKIAEAEQIKKEKTENEAKVHLEKCKNMVTGYARQGRIKNEEAEINDWTKLAIVDYGGIENRLKALPINAKAASIETVENNSSSAGTGKYSAALVMGSVQAKLAIKK